MSASSRSSRSSGSSSGSSRSGSSRRHKTRILPHTKAVNTLIYCAGRRPRDVKAIRVYEWDWDDDFSDAGSSWSAGSWNSWASWSTLRHGKQREYYFIESPYWQGRDDWDDSRPQPKAHKSGGVKRGSPGKGMAQDDSDSGSGSEDDSDDGSDGSLDDYGHEAQGGFPPPGMMPPHGGQMPRGPMPGMPMPGRPMSGGPMSGGMPMPGLGGPPQGGFPPARPMYPQQTQFSPHLAPSNRSPPIRSPPPGGSRPGPPPGMGPQRPGPGPPPGPPGQPGFVRGPGGIQVWEN